MGLRFILLLCVCAGASSGCALFPCNCEITHGALREALDAEAGKQATADPARTRALEAEIAQLRAAEVAEHALHENDSAPLLELPSTRGGVVALAKLLKRGPVVIVWYRDGGCPYCALTLQRYQEALPYFKNHKATLLAIGPESPGVARKTARRLKLTFDVLSDSNNRTALQFGLVYTDGGAGMRPLAASYLIDQAGIIRYALVDADHRRRAEPADVVDALHVMTGVGRELRP